MNYSIYYKNFTKINDYIIEYGDLPHLSIDNNNKIIVEILDEKIVFLKNEIIDHFSMENYTHNIHIITENIFEQLKYMKFIGDNIENTQNNLNILENIINEINKIEFTRINSEKSNSNDEILIKIIEQLKLDLLTNN